MERKRFVLLIIILPSIHQAPIGTSIKPSFGVIETTRNSPHHTQDGLMLYTTLETHQPLQVLASAGVKAVPMNTPAVVGLERSTTIIVPTYSTITAKDHLLTTSSISQGNSTNSSIDTNKKGNLKIHRWHNYFLLFLMVLSLLGLVINFSFMASICSCNGVPVVILFGICLMLFNILISLYGVGITIHLYESPLHWSQRFCQGLTSMKLFSLGSSVWTLITLTFHHSIKESTEEERDAVFKGIVYVLEGVMLSGVLAVMAWIKLDSWNYLCAIIEPKTTVEWLLTGIELWFYFIAILLIIRYPVHLIRRRATSKTNQTKGHQEHPIFIMIFTSFLCWSTAYAITFPHVGIFDFQTSAVIRVCAILFVTILQPILYTLRGTFCCTGRNPPCKKKIITSTNEVLLVCNCTGAETCPACDSEYDVRTRYGNTVFADSSATEEQKEKVNGKVKEIIKRNKKRKKKKDNVATPKAVPRSPEIRTTMEGHHFKFEIDEDDQKEEAPLLVNQKEESIPEKTAPTQVNRKYTDRTPLLDDTDGRNPPKALPDDSPSKSVKKNRQSEFPSFINLKTAANVDELPKEKKQLTLHDILADSETTFSAQERVSRGPTFYSIDPQPNKENVSNGSSKELVPQPSHENDSKSPSCQLVKNTDVAEKVNEGDKTEQKSKGPKKRRRRKKTSDMKRNSTESLEWDHSYTDSSGSGSLVEETVQHKVNDVQSCEKDYNMEWDPSCIDIRITSFDEPASHSPSTAEPEPNLKDDVRNGHSVGDETSKPSVQLTTDGSSDQGSNNSIEHGINGLKKSEEENSDVEREKLVTSEVKSEVEKQKTEKKRKAKKKEKMKHKQENGKVKEEKLKLFKKKKKEEQGVES